MGSDEGNNELAMTMKGKTDGARQRATRAQAYLTRAQMHWSLCANPKLHESKGQFAFAVTSHTLAAKEATAALIAYRDGELNDTALGLIESLKSVRSVTFAQPSGVCDLFTNRHQQDVKRVQQCLYRHRETCQRQMT